MFPSLLPPGPRNMRLLDIQIKALEVSIKTQKFKDPLYRVRGIL